MQKAPLFALFMLSIGPSITRGQQPLGPDPAAPLLGPGPALIGNGPYGEPMLGPAMPQPAFAPGPQSPPYNPYSVPPGGFGPGSPVPPQNPPPAGIATSTTTAVESKPAKPAKTWEGSLELGVAGSDGNSPNLNLHAGGKIKATTDFDTFTSEIQYHDNSVNSIETENRGTSESRYEHRFGTSPWTWYLHEETDYDQFKSYEWLASVDSGVGYKFLKDDSNTLTGRFGGGTSREFGGPSPDTRYIPEVVFGLEGEHKIDKRQKFTASVEYRPDVASFSTYRVNSKIAWEVLLSEENHLTLKFSATDLYDSDTAVGSKPSDLDYTVTFLWGF